MTIILLFKIFKNKTGVIHDPLGQPTVPAGSDCPSNFKFLDGRTLCENSDHYRPGLWSASWINKKISMFSASLKPSTLKESLGHKIPAIKLHIFHNPFRQKSRPLNEEAKHNNVNHAPQIAYSEIDIINILPFYIPTDRVRITVNCIST